jgi:NADH:ubiquinone oxidoreductase subunit 6 (subunit J)
MILEIMQLISMVLVFVFAVMAVETRDILYAILSFCGMCITMGGVFWLSGAVYIAIFQLLIYAGAVIALLIATITLTTRTGSVE